MDSEVLMIDSPPVDIGSPIEAPPGIQYDNYASAYDLFSQVLPPNIDLYYSDETESQINENPEVSLAEQLFGLPVANEEENTIGDSFEVPLASYEEVEEQIIEQPLELDQQIELLPLPIEQVTIDNENIVESLVALEEDEPILEYHLDEASKETFEEPLQEHVEQTIIEQPVEKQEDMLIDLVPETIDELEVKRIEIREHFEHAKDDVKENLDLAPNIDRQAVKQNIKDYLENPANVIIPERQTSIRLNKQMPLATEEEIEEEAKVKEMGFSVQMVVDQNATYEQIRGIEKACERIEGYFKDFLKEEIGLLDAYNKAIEEIYTTCVKEDIKSACATILLEDGSILPILYETSRVDYTSNETESTIQNFSGLKTIYEIGILKADKDSTVVAAVNAVGQTINVLGGENDPKFIVHNGDVIGAFVADEIPVTEDPYFNDLDIDLPQVEEVYEMAA